MNQCIQAYEACVLPTELTCYRWSDIFKVDSEKLLPIERLLVFPLLRSVAYAFYNLVYLRGFDPRSVVFQTTAFTRLA